MAPSQVPWGQKVLGAYLGNDPQAWKAWDSVELVKALAADQGSTSIDKGKVLNIVTSSQNI